MTILLGTPDDSISSGFVDDRLYVNGGTSARTAVASGTADTFNLNVTSLNGNPTVNIRPAIYDTNKNLVWEGAAFSASVGINSVPISPTIPIVSGTTELVLGFIADLDFYGTRDALVAGGTDYDTTLYTDPLPDPYVIDAYISDPATMWLSDDGSAAPTLTNIDGGTTYAPGASVVLNGTNLGTTGGSLDANSVVQTITEQLDGGVTFTAVRGGNPYNIDLTLTYDSGTGTPDTLTVQQVAGANEYAVTAASPNTTDSESLWTGLIDTVTSDPITIVDGDQALLKDVNTLGNLSATGAGVVSADTTGEYVVQIWIASEGVWGGDQTVTFTLADTTAPTITSASVPTTGDNIAVQMDEPMQVGAGGTGGWTISLGDATVSAAAVDGVDDTIINLTPSRTLTTADTLTIGYTQPGDGFQDQATTPNDLATLAAQVVTNNSTQAPPDVTGPVVVTVDVPANATYAIGESLVFTGNFDEAVTVTGTPRLALDIGGTVRYADYESGTGTAALLFRHIVLEGDSDADGIQVTGLELNGGTLQDAATNNATLTLNGVGATTGILVDGIRPVVTVDDLNTIDTTPTVSGSAGDAVSLTLTVNAVQYNPTPSGGSWSQALPELAVDTYPMTLDGVDAVGNTAVQADGTLTIAVTPPVGLPVFGTILVGETTATIPVTYTDGDEDSLEYSLDGAAYVTFVSPIELTGLLDNTLFAIDVRARNVGGAGSIASTTFTTENTPDVPAGLITFGEPSIAATSFSLPYTYNDTDETGFEHRIDGGAWVVSTSPIVLQDATPETAYTVDAKAVNFAGDGAIATTIVTTEAAPVVADETMVERVYSITASIDDFPVAQAFSMYQGDRVRLNIVHTIDMAGKQLKFRIASKSGQPGKFTITTEDDTIVITTALSELLNASDKLWQLILREGDSLVVVAQGSVNVLLRIKEA